MPSKIKILNLNEIKKQIKEQMYLDCVAMVKVNLNTYLFLSKQIFEDFELVDSGLLRKATNLEIKYPANKKKIEFWYGTDESQADYADSVRNSLGPNEQYKDRDYVKYGAKQFKEYTETGDRKQIFRKGAKPKKFTTPVYLD